MSEFERVINLLEKLKGSKEGKSFIDHLECFSNFENKRLQRGWERWLQYEMLYLLSRDSQSELRNPEFEVQYNYDSNFPLPKGKVGKKRANIDFVYETIGTNKGIRHAVELKMARTLRKALNAGVKDIFRIQAIEENVWNFRSVFSLAIFIDAPETETKYAGLFKDLQQENYFKVIQLTENYKALFFGWEKPPRRANRENYIEWCDKLNNLFLNRKVDVWTSAD